MKHWWNRNGSLTDGDNVQGGYSKDTIEDCTGCIPLLLNSCIQNGEMRLDAAPIISAWKEVSSFVAEIRIRADKVPRYWTEYTTLP